MKEFVLTADYHTHTKYSDGNGSIEDNVKEAVNKGLNEIGITEHGFNHVKAGVKRSQIPEMRAEINRLQKIYPNIKIYLGVEANLLNLKGELDITEDDIKSLDYIIFGIHKATYGKRVKGSLWFNFRNLFPTSKKYKQKVTDSCIKAMEKYPIKIVVHPNYATKCDVKRLADACAKNDVLFELNGKRIMFDDAEIEVLKNSNAKFVLSSDSHYPERVGTIELQKEFIKKYNFPLEKIVNIKISN